MNLNGQVALVTGSGSPDGIGYATAELFAAEEGFIFGFKRGFTVLACRGQSWLVAHCCDQGEES